MRYYFAIQFTSILIVPILGLYCRLQKCRGAGGKQISIALPKPLQKKKCLVGIFLRPHSLMVVNILVSQTKAISDEWAHQRVTMEAHIAALQHDDKTEALEKELAQKQKEVDDWRGKVNVLQTLTTGLEASLQEKDDRLTLLEVF